MKNQDFLQVKKFMNLVEGSELDMQASIALLRRDEFVKRIKRVVGEVYSYYGTNCTSFIYSFISSSFDSKFIVESAMEIECIIRCLETMNNKMSKEKVYSKYIGYFRDEDSIDNLYFCSRLNSDQKLFVASELDIMTKEEKMVFTDKVNEDIELSINPKKLKKI